MKRLLPALLLLLCAGNANAQTHKFDMKNEMARAKQQVLNSGPGFELVGKVEHGKKTPYSINGEDFTITIKTQVEGELQIGANADVSGKILEGNKKVANLAVVAQSNQSQESSSTGPIKTR